MNEMDNSDKEIVSGKKGILSLPGFPIVIGCIGKNLMMGCCLVVIYGQL